MLISLVPLHKSEITLTFSPSSCSPDTQKCIARNDCCHLVWGISKFIFHYFDLTILTTHRRKGVPQGKPSSSQILTPSITMKQQQQQTETTEMSIILQFTAQRKTNHLYEMKEWPRLQRYAEIKASLLLLIKVHNIWLVKIAVQKQEWVHNF